MLGQNWKSSLTALMLDAWLSIYIWRLSKTSGGGAGAASGGAAGGAGAGGRWRRNGEPIKIGQGIGGGAGAHVSGTSIARRFHFDVTSNSLRCHLEVTPNWFRVHFEFSSISIDVLNLIVIYRLPPLSHTGTTRDHPRSHRTTFHSTWRNKGKHQTKGTPTTCRTRSINCLLIFEFLLRRQSVFFPKTLAKGSCSNWPGPCPFVFPDSGKLPCPYRAPIANAPFVAISVLGE